MVEEGGASLAETPTYAVAIVISAMIALGAFFQGSLEWSAKLLKENKRKALVAALEKIKDELMLFGLLSLLMGHWIMYITKICINSSTSSSRFYPCVRQDVIRALESVVFPSLKKLNESVYSIDLVIGRQNHCPKGHEPFVSYEGLEQLHRLLFALVIVHVSYSFAAITLAITKIYSWQTWENHAKRMAIKEGSPGKMRMMRLSTFIFHHTLHPWSKDRVLVWLLCFGRQFWSSVNRVDYIALRWGFITTHKLPLSYNFHNYMVRSMEEEFCDIVGIRLPFWIYAIFCILLNFHGTNIYFWFSFLPAILILLVGTKLHRVVVKLAVEIRDSCPATGHHHHLNLRDELFWFGKPKLLLWLVHFITFQNAFEMATFLWSLWEIQGASCFMDDSRFLMTRLIFGVVSQFWCSFITFPLYVLVTQMGSSFKQALISENARRSLSMWRQRAGSRSSCTSSSRSLLHETSATSTTCSLDEQARTSSFSRSKGGSSRTKMPRREASLSTRGSHKTLKELILEDPYHCIPSSDDCGGGGGGGNW